MFNEDGTDPMNDLWKYYIEQNQWEEVNALGINSISKIVRINLILIIKLKVRQWDGTTVTKAVETIDKTVSKFLDNCV